MSENTDTSLVKAFEEIKKGFKPGEIFIITSPYRPGRSMLDGFYMQELARRQGKSVTLQILKERNFDVEMGRHRKLVLDSMTMIMDECHEAEPQEAEFSREREKAQDTSLKTRLKTSKDAKAKNKPSSLLSNMLGRL